MCSICLHEPCLTQCPNFTPKINCFCSICGEGVLPGDEYLENYDGEYIHYDCVSGNRDLVEWLGFEIKTMDDYGT